MVCTHLSVCSSSPLFEKPLCTSVVPNTEITHWGCREAKKVENKRHLSNRTGNRIPSSNKNSVFVSRIFESVLDQKCGSILCKRTSEINFRRETSKYSLEYSWNKNFFEAHFRGQIRHVCTDWRNVKHAIYTYEIIPRLL